MQRTWTLLDPDRQPFASARPGTLGGHRGTGIFGRLDCPAAWPAGYRPCAVCLPKEYATWKSTGKK
jgi:hypothetical protein